MFGADQRPATVYARAEDGSRSVARSSSGAGAACMGGTQALDLYSIDHYVWDRLRRWLRKKHSETSWRELLRRY